jgi:hypothetical protein
VATPSSCGTTPSCTSWDQLPHGAGAQRNFYFDEFFWVHGFAEINKVASGMALHKKWRKTYFSTPSSMAHPAYNYWTGERFNKGKPTAQHIQLDVSHEALQQGRLLRGPHLAPDRHHPRCGGPGLRSV